MGNLTLNFGKYIGVDLDKVPTSYLRYVFEYPSFYKARKEIKKYIIDRLIKESVVKLHYKDNIEFNNQEWISVNNKPDKTQFVMCAPHNRLLLYCSGLFYNHNTWLVKEDITHWKPLSK
jgi:hypothetical protein